MPNLMGVEKRIEIRHVKIGSWENCSQDKPLAFKFKETLYVMYSRCFSIQTTELCVPEGVYGRAKTITQIF